MHDEEDEYVKSFDCPVCDWAVFWSDDKGMFEEQDGVCPNCATICWISVDQETAYINSEEKTADLGQPKCLNECDLLYAPKGDVTKSEFYGQPCRLTCAKAQAACPPNGWAKR